MSFIFKTSLLGMLFVLLVACSGTKESNPVPTPSKSEGSFPALPTNTTETVVLDGEMVFWLYEGSGGCFGAISDGSKEVQLWIDAEACGETEYAENDDAVLEVTFNTDNQYGPEVMYTIVNFL